MHNHRKYVAKQKVLYSKIGTIICPALNDELVYFNNHGFNHLIRKNGILRPPEEQINRLYLLTAIREILEDKDAKPVLKSSCISSKLALFWSFTKTVKSKRIKVILRKVGNGRVHFFSIFSSE